MALQLGHHVRNTTHVPVFLDSLQDPKDEAEDYCAVLKTYADHEYEDKTHLYEARSTITRKWGEVISPSVVHQRNGYDCGVWICIYCYCLCRGIDPKTFRGKCPWFRKHILLSICKNKLVDFIQYPALF